MSNPVNKIAPSKLVKMTAVLLRAFAALGCRPTVCHACDKEIVEGDSFKLVPHREFVEWDMHDEMCCETCGEQQLRNRGRRERRQERIGGYSRPSSAQRGES